MPTLLLSTTPALAPPRRRTRHLPPDAHESEYVDSGCSLAPSCLNCPFEVCRYDRAAARVGRDAEIRRLYRERGLTFGQLSTRFGLTRKRVWRIVRTAEG